MGLARNDGPQGEVVALLACGVAALRDFYLLLFRRRAWSKPGKPSLLSRDSTPFLQSDVSFSRWESTAGHTVQATWGYASSATTRATSKDPCQRVASGALCLQHRPQDSGSIQPADGQKRYKKRDIVIKGRRAHALLLLRRQWRQALSYGSTANIRLTGGVPKENTPASGESRGCPAAPGSGVHRSVSRSTQATGHKGACRAYSVDSFAEYEITKVAASCRAEYYVEKERQKRLVLVAQHIQGGSDATGGVDEQESENTQAGRLTGRRCTWQGKLEEVRQREYHTSSSPGWAIRERQHARTWRTVVSEAGRR